MSWGTDPPGKSAPRWTENGSINLVTQRRSTVTPRSAAQISWNCTCPWGWDTSYRVACHSRHPTCLQARVIRWYHPVGWVNLGRISGRGGKVCNRWQGQTWASLDPLERTTIGRADLAPCHTCPYSGTPVLGEVAIVPDVEAVLFVQLNTIV